MTKTHDETVSMLVASVLGERAEQAIETLDLDAVPVSGRRGLVDRLTLSKALAIVLFQHLVDHVPTASAYVDERRADGGRVLFDHGAIRTVRFPSSATGGLPSGEKAITRILRPLGYVLAGTYPLPVLKMTGRAYLHADAPEHMPQFFVSELHVERFDGDFATVAARVFGQSADPLGETSMARLSFLAETGVLALADAKGLLSEIVTAFGRHHPIPSLSDYRALLESSAEAAWIATEGNAFNHATDRVRDLDALVARERSQQRPMKDAVEVSINGRIRQTAHPAARVVRTFRCEDGDRVDRIVPGSFYEFISRDRDPETGRIDLGFDSGNATGIFAMTKAA